MTDALRKYQRKSKELAEAKVQYGVAEHRLKEARQAIKEEYGSVEQAEEQLAKQKRLQAKLNKKLESLLEEFDDEYSVSG